MPAIPTFTVVQPVISANRRPLFDNLNGPDMRQTVQGYSKPMVLEVISLTAGEGGDAVETTRTVNTDGYTIAMTARQLGIKDDGSGTRKWKYWSVFLMTDPGMSIGDKFKINGSLFKVIEQWDRSQNGFFKLNVVEDFQG